MSDSRWQQLEDIFHRALEIAPEGRSAFLDRACDGDPSLRREVESLLAHEKEHGDTFAPGEALPSKALAAGDRLGPYEISGLIGAGGMGEVYRAYESRLRRSVALKVLPSEVSGDAARRVAFEQEAHAAAALNHPYIAAIYGLEEANGVSAIAMELVEGSTLSERIAKGPIPVAKALEWAKQIAEALQYAHDKGVIHRDLKPGNIMVAGEGHVKVLDFGLARRMRPAAETGGSEVITNTGRGQITGTVGYMAPEQVRGMAVDRRADLFSFGVVLYEMVTGERPFAGTSTMAVLDAILHDPPRVIHDGAVSGRLKAIITKLLEKDAARRYASAGEVVLELRALEAQPPRSKTVWIAMGAVVVAVVLAGWLWRGWSRERWAHTVATPEIARFIDSEEYSEAAPLARETLSVVPKDVTLENLWMRATGEVSMVTDPVGAELAMRPYHRHSDAWEVIGQTPVKKVRVPMDDYVWRISKSGFAPIFLIARPAKTSPPPGSHSTFNFLLKLRPAASVPPEMVLVASLGPVGLAYPYGTPRLVRMRDFLIDRHDQPGLQEVCGGWRLPEARVLEAAIRQGRTNALF